VEAKARRNVIGHAISFMEAATIFDDPLAVSYQCIDHSAEENRYVIIGQSNQKRLLVVAYTQRKRTRIVSACKVTPRERRMYEESEEEF
jgi:uncharacterized DUF497 family protein